MITVKPLAAACAAALMVAGCVIDSSASAQTVPEAPPSLTSQSSPSTTGNDSTGTGVFPGDNSGPSSYTFTCTGGGATCGSPSPPPPPPPTCGVPVPSTRDVPGTVGCPAGQLGQENVVYHQQAVWSCPSEYGSPVEGPWTTVSTTVVSNTCAAACVAPAPTSVTQSQRASCPSGQVYKGGPATTFTQTRTATTSWSCPASTGAPVSSTAYSAWSPAAGSVCAPPPPPPPPPPAAFTNSLSLTGGGQNNGGPCTVNATSFAVSGVGMCGMGLAIGKFTGTLVYAGQSHNVSLSCSGVPGSGAAKTSCGASTTFTLAGKTVKVSLSAYTTIRGDGGSIDNGAQVQVTGVPWTPQPNVCIQPAGSTGVCSVP